MNQRFVWKFIQIIVFVFGKLRVRSKWNTYKRCMIVGKVDRKMLPVCSFGVVSLHTVQISLQLKPTFWQSGVFGVLHRTPLIDSFFFRCAQSNPWIFIASRDVESVEIIYFVSSCVLEERQSRTNPSSFVDSVPFPTAKNIQPTPGTTHRYV